MFVGTPFQGVGGGESFTYADIKVNCGETEETSETGWVALADAIVMLDDQGTFKRNVVYVPEWLKGEFDLTEKGWYDGDNIVEGESYNAEPLDFGIAVQAYITDAALEPKVEFAGQVKTGPTVTDLLQSRTSIANCAAKKIYAEDLIVNCGETEETSETGWVALADAIVMLDDQGTFKRNVVYVPEWLKGEFDLTEKGWYDGDNIVEGESYNHSEDLCWEGGVGFQVYITDAGLEPTITIKSALAQPVVE